MNLLAMCITWNRPQLLGRSIYCFLQQTDPNARLFVLDDAGQYTSQEHERWTLFSTSKRYPTMGEKRNALIDMAIQQYPQIEGFMLWDDDDVYFPHAVECVANALDLRCWAQPRLALEMTEDGQSLRRVKTCSSRNPEKESGGSIGYGGCWAWRLDVFEKLGGFSVTNHSEDLRLARPCQERFGDSANSTPEEPWYYYNRLNNTISKEGRHFYALRGNQKVEPVRELSIGWNGPNIFEMPIEDGIHPRPW